VTTDLGALSTKNGVVERDRHRLGQHPKDPSRRQPDRGSRDLKNGVRFEPDECAPIPRPRDSSNETRRRVLLSNRGRWSLRRSAVHELFAVFHDQPANIEHRQTNSVSSPARED